ncbi:MAG: MotA/TolQ/ExbB proton channel family protein [Planctomycetaceae bacterium]
MNELSDVRNLWEMFLAGGPLMWPIAALSVVVLAFALERAWALRPGRFVPRGFAADLDRLVGERPCDPRRVRERCDRGGGVAGAVLRAATARAGRPAAEVERAVEVAKEREAAALYANIRPITLAVQVTPLLGLLGTVQGMILAFYTTAQLEAGANRAAELASGIYVALITTFAGLCVAIPAAVLAHLLEGRIMAGFRRVDALLARVLPAIESGEADR